MNTLFAFAVVFVISCLLFILLASIASSIALYVSQPEPDDSSDGEWLS